MINGISVRTFSFKIFGIVMAAISAALSCCLTLNGLSPEAVRTLGVLAATLFLLIFESFPVCVSCLLSSAMLYALGCVGTMAKAFAGFSNHILYFTIASFGLSLAFQKSMLSRRLLELLLRTGRIGVKKLTFLFMLCAAALSAIMSNVAAVVIFIPYVESFLDHFRNEEHKKISRRCMMICLTVSALIGGMITPAGSSMNLICLDMLETYAGTHVRFIDWMIAGFPLALVMLIAAFMIITAVYPPAEPSDTEMAEYLTGARQKKRMGFQDIYIGLLIFGILFTWVLSSWIPAINVTVTSIIGLAFMFVPGFSVMSWEEFSASISWPTFFIAGNLISVSNAVTSTGLCDFFTGLLFPNEAGHSEILLVARIAVITFVFMACLPSAPAVISILSPIIIAFAGANGLNPAMLVMASAFCVSNIYLFPLDAPLVVAYDRKAFQMFDLPKATIWIQLFMVLLVSLWVPLIFHLAF